MLCLGFFCKIRSSLMIVVRLGEKSKYQNTDESIVNT